MDLIETGKLDQARYNAGLETDDEDEYVAGGELDDDTGRHDSAIPDYDDPIYQG